MILRCAICFIEVDMRLQWRYNYHNWSYHIAAMYDFHKHTQETQDSLPGKK